MSRMECCAAIPRLHACRVKSGHMPSMPPGPELRSQAHVVDSCMRRNILGPTSPAAALAFVPGCPPPPFVPPAVDVDPALAGPGTAASVRLALAPAQRFHHSWCLP